MVHPEISRRAALRVALFSFMLWFILPVAPMMTAALAQTTFKKDKLTVRTTSGAHVIAIEIAETSEQKALGLMYRQTVPQGTGMLFPYGQPQEITMWMRNTYASLDMIFIRADGTVHRIEYSTEPMSERIIPSRGLVTAVLELGAGEAKRLGINPGDRVEHPSIKPGKR
jgi:uncharacterized membrane protein (UPF0127 family)